MSKIYDNVAVIASLVPATITATTNGAGVDTFGYNDGMFVVAAGAIDLTSTNETYAFKVQDSDDNSTFTDVSGLTTTISANNQIKEIPLRELNLTLRRYVRVVATLAGTTPSFAGTAVAVLGNPVDGPVGNSNA